MTVLTYVTGDVTRPEGTGPRVIVNVCNDAGKWGRGFGLPLSDRWEAPEQNYRLWARGKLSIRFMLGQVQFVTVEPELWVANLIGLRGIMTYKGIKPMRYDALRTGLARIAFFAHEYGATIHMPLIGEGGAGGDWPTIADMLIDEFDGLNVTVYDMPKSQMRARAIGQHE